ncbi:MAG TPA: acyl carrier protein [bacterium]
MTADAMLQRVCQIAADVFDVPLDAVTSQSSPETIENWDSLQHVTLVVALEQAFAVQFLPEEISEMLTIERIASLVEQKMAPVATP